MVSYFFTQVSTATFVTDYVDKSVGLFPLNIVGASLMQGLGKLEYSMFRNSLTLLSYLCLRET